MIDFSKFSKTELLEIHDNLSSYNWDDRIGDKPDGYDNYPHYSKNKWQITKVTIIRPYFQAIESLLSEREILKYHHLHNLHKNIFQFYFWWFTRGRLMSAIGGR
jgi:hypothetical protein